jgi:hypothetical protein
MGSLPVRFSYCGIYNNIYSSLHFGVSHTLFISLVVKKWGIIKEDYDGDENDDGYDGKYYYTVENKEKLYDVLINAEKWNELEECEKVIVQHLPSFILFFYLLIAGYNNYSYKFYCKMIQMCNRILKTLIRMINFLL